MQIFVITISFGIPFESVLSAVMSGKCKFLTLLGLLVAYVSASSASNILCVFTSQSPSHNIIHMSYVTVLLEHGHNVTVVTTAPLKDKNPRYHHIYIAPSKERIKDLDEIRTEMVTDSGFIGKIRRALASLSIMSNIEFDALKSQRFQNFMHNSDNKFDLLIMGYFMTDYQIGLGVHFKCPVIISWMSGWNMFINRYVGNPLEISYVQASPMTGLDAYTFIGRLNNFIFGIIMRIFLAISDRQTIAFYNELFPSPDYPSFDEAAKKVTLVFSNSHFSEGLIRPNVPAAVEVGGIQIKDKPDPLPKDLNKIVNDSSEHGVIILCFGSNLKTNHMKPELLQIIFKALAGLKQTVLWKLDGRETPGSSPNVHYLEWLPQDDLLAHPNLKLFITHAGKGSVAESQYHGVPMVTVPFFGDQDGNAEQVERDGFGINVDHSTVTIDVLRAAIHEVLQNQKFAENVRRFSALYRDRPMSARDTAAYWIEYVIRHKGAYHMQSPLVHLNFWQYVSADVIGFLLAVIFLVYKLVRSTARFALRKVFGKECAKEQKAKQH